MKIASKPGASFFKLKGQNTELTPKKRTSPETVHGIVLKFTMLADEDGPARPRRRAAHPQTVHPRWAQRSTASMPHMSRSKRRSLEITRVAVQAQVTIKLQLEAQV